MNHALRHISVLLIEDNCDDEWFAKWTLKKIGLTEVTTARDGYEALRLLHGDSLRGIRPSCSPDIILLDLRLPKIDGLEVLRQIRNNHQTKNCIVIILTSTEDPHDKNVCSKLGVTALLPKPLTMEALVKLKLFPVSPDAA